MRLEKRLSAAAAAKDEFKPGVAYLKLIATSREADLREGLLFRQGKGYLCTPSAGHENMAAIACAADAGDYIFCHYRDRALLLARGATLASLALTFLAKKDSSSGGRQMAGHYSAPELNVISHASPVGSQCLPAAGAAWACKLDGRGRIAVCCIGDAGLRQGEFYEAFAFAVQERLPIVFVVEDNGYGISTPTENMNPFKLGVLSRDRVMNVDGRRARDVYAAMRRLADEARDGRGPFVLSLAFDRLMSHTSSDDQKLYRAAGELDAFGSRDPIALLRDALIAEGELDEEQWSAAQGAIREEVKAAYAEALNAAEPEAGSPEQDVRGDPPKGRRGIGFLEETPELTYAQAVNRSLRHLLESDGRVLLFGQDIEDPKGGVFGLTRGLSARFPGRVVNSPLAEATICGTAVGLALAGYLPIFEIQFIDFVATGFNQIVNQMATLRWRTAGGLTCPAILMAPCGGYVQGAGPWHTQTNESLFAHTPGLQVHMPSTATDVADILVNCAAGEDPVVILMPKHLFFKNFPAARVPNIRHDRAAILQEGSDVTIVAWGNCVELALDAMQALKASNISAEVIDCKTVAPCDTRTLAASLAKTGRIVVVHEDNRTCSVGQSIIAEIVSNRDTWNMLYAGPRHVCRDDALIPFNPHLARAAMPTVDKIVAAAVSTMG
jgi:2-oxoisovalerate dehydrogenase E1 component